MIGLRILNLSGHSSLYDEVTSPRTALPQTGEGIYHQMTVHLPKGKFYMPILHYLNVSEMIMFL